MVRCRLLAEELAKKSIDAGFLFSHTDKEIKKEISKSFRTITFSENRELQQIPQILKKYANKLVIFDTDEPKYYNEEFQLAIKKAGAKLMYITIFDQHYYHADILLNPNITAESAKFRTTPGTIKLLGPEYFIFKPAFRENSYLLSESKARFRGLVSFGTSDPQNLTGKLLNSLLSVENYFESINVVSGRLNVHLSGLREMISAFPSGKLNLHINTSVMLELIKASNLAFTACGLTFWELTSMNIPSFIAAASEREKASYHYFLKYNYAMPLGTYDSFITPDKFKRTFEVVSSKNILDILATNELRNKINSRGIDLVISKIYPLLNKEL